MSQSGRDCPPSAMAGALISLVLLVWSPYLSSAARAQPSDSSAASNALQAQSVLQQARQALARHDLNDAALGFKHYSALLPGDPRGYFWLGLTLDQAGDSSSALEAYRQAVDKSNDLGMDSAEMRVDLGNCLVKLNWPKQAEYDFRRAIEIDPRLPAAHFALARLLIILGQAQEALSELDRYQQLHGTDPALPLERARALSQLGRTDEAKALLQSYLSQKEAHPQALNSEAGLLLQELTNNGSKAP